jgi:hypothetical protein
MRSVNGLVAGLVLATLTTPALAQSVLKPGQTVNGALAAGDPVLSDQSHFDCFRVQTRSGELYQVTMRSAAFDAYLSVGAGSSCAGDAVVSDDDGAGGTDAAATFSGNGETWFVRANSLGAGQTGAYTLTFSAAASQASETAPWAGRTPEEVCAYRAGSRRFEMVMARTATVRFGGAYRTEGVIVVDGRDISREDAGITYARGHPWYDAGEPIRIRGRTYQKYGLPRIVSLNELEFFAEHDGVGVGVERGDQSHDVIYLIDTSLECAFQPYEAIG